MITPALPRWVAGLLADVSTGVNVWAPQVPRDITEAAPPDVSIYNAVDDAFVARKQGGDDAAPDDWVVFVRVAEEIQLAGDPGAGSIEDTATIIIELTGLTVNAENAIALAAAYRIMRAVRRVLHTAFIALQMEPLVLEGTQITLPTQLQGFTLDGKAGAGQVSLAIALPFTLTDTWALGAEETP